MCGCVAVWLCGCVAVWLCGCEWRCWAGGGQRRDEPMFLAATRDAYKSADFQRRTQKECVFAIYLFFNRPMKWLIFWREATMRGKFPPRFPGKRTHRPPCAMLAAPPAKRFRNCFDGMAAVWWCKAGCKGVFGRGGKPWPASFQPVFAAHRRVRTGKPPKPCYLKCNKGFVGVGWRGAQIAMWGQCGFGWSWPGWKIEIHCFVSQCKATIVIIVFWYLWTFCDFALGVSL